MVYSDIGGPSAYRMDGTFTTDASDDLISWSIALKEPGNYYSGGFTNVGCQTCAFKTHDGYHFQDSVGIGSSFSPRLDLSVANNVLTDAMYSSHNPGVLMSMTSGSIAALPVPEPTLLIWLGIGLAGLYARLKRA